MALLYSIHNSNDRLLRLTALLKVMFTKPFRLTIAGKVMFTVLNFHHKLTHYFVL